MSASPATLEWHVEIRFGLRNCARQIECVENRRRRRKLPEQCRARTEHGSTRLRLRAPVPRGRVRLGG